MRSPHGTGYTVVETHKGGDGGATGMTFTSVQQVQLLHSSFGVCNTCAAAAENKEEKKKKKKITWNICFPLHRGANAPKGKLYPLPTEDKYI